MRDLISEVAEELGVSKEVVKDSRDAYWRHMRNMIGKIPISTMTDLGELEGYQVAFKVAKFGTFHLNIPKIRKRIKVNNDKCEEAEADVQQDGCDG